MAKKMADRKRVRAIGLERFGTEGITPRRRRDGRLKDT
ncbi:hypothetical protein Mycsm_01878 [Mycobacterium sp. JS623]|nr:hypothetical protein Mycsm_01878 [Mycobacterium sp. JS623]